MRITLAFVVLFFVFNICRGQNPNAYTVEQIDSLYHTLSSPSSMPSYKIFYEGMVGYEKLTSEDKIQNSRYLTLIDFSMSANTKRLWVIDLDSMKVVTNSLVAHGRNSGDEYAARFSNTMNSYMSSIGFFVTGQTYNGKHGESLYLEGIEPGVNDNARKRAIVIHAADYVSRDFIKKYGRIGRSHGCPALPPAVCSAVIDTIKDKSCLFIYYPDPDYLANSTYLN